MGLMEFRGVEKNTTFQFILALKPFQDTQSLSYMTRYQGEYS